MDPLLITIVNIGFNTAVILLFANYVFWPRLQAMSLASALVPLVLLHAMRHVGLIFLSPAIVSPELAPAFAQPAAWGDLLAAVLALITVYALRTGVRGSITMAWVFNIVGFADFAYALTQGIRYDVIPHLGAAVWIPIFWVPVLLVSHILIFRLLWAHRTSPVPNERQPIPVRAR